MKQIDLKLEEEPYEIKLEEAEERELEPLENKGVQRAGRIKLTLVGLCIAFAGSFFNFWGVRIEGLGRLAYGNLFNGYKLGGILGIFFALGIAAAFGFACTEWNRFALLAVLWADAMLLLQLLIIALWGKGSFSSYKGVSVYLDTGFYICIIGTVLSTIFSYWNFKREK